MLLDLLKLLTLLALLISLNLERHFETNIYQEV